jgi:uncharacterized protein YjdB
MRLKGILLSLILLTPVLISAGCGGGSKKATGVTLAVSSASVAAGRTTQITATITYSDHTTATNPAGTTFASSDTTVATVGANGLVTTLKAGTATITATFNGKSGTTVVTVTPAVPNTISFSSINGSLAKGLGRSINLSGTMTDGSVTPDSYFDSCAWTAPSVVSLKWATGMSNYMTAREVGTGTISVTCGDVTQTTGVTVTAAEITDLDVTPATATIDVNATQQFIATATFTDDSTEIVTSTVEWSVSETEIASVASGLVTGLAAGETTVIANYQSGVKTASAAITVKEASVESCGTGLHNDALSGTYSFELRGKSDVYKGYVGTLTFDGAGNITEGSYRFRYGYGGGDNEIGTYSIKDGINGCLFIPDLDLTMRLMLSPHDEVASEAKLLEFDTPSSSALVASGVLLKQDSTISNPLSGNFVLSGSGGKTVDDNEVRVGMIGKISFDAALAKSSGEMDWNVGGALNPDNTLPNTSWSRNQVNDYGTGYAEVWTASGIMQLFAVSDSEYFFSAYEDGAWMFGKMLKQTGTFDNSSLDGKVVGYLSGLSYDGGSGSAAAIEIGIYAGDGTASFARNANDSGTFSQEAGGFYYSVDSNGRVLLNSGHYGVLYLTAPNTGVKLTTWSGVNMGEFEPQATDPFNLADLNARMRTVDVASQNATPEIAWVFLGDSGEVGGASDWSSVTGQDAGDPLTGTYSVSTDGVFQVADSDLWGVAISNTKIVLIDSTTSTWPSIQVAAGTILRP